MEAEGLGVIHMSERALQWAVGVCVAAGVGEG